MYGPTDRPTDDLAPEAAHGQPSGPVILRLAREKREAEAELRRLDNLLADSCGPGHAIAPADTHKGD